MHQKVLALQGFAAAAAVSSSFLKHRCEKGQAVFDAVC
jgi:hypothetical protein